MAIGLAKNKKQADSILYGIAVVFFLMFLYFGWKFVIQLTPPPVEILPEVPDVQP